MSDCAIVCGLRLETAICEANCYADKVERLGELTARKWFTQFRTLTSRELNDDLREEIETLILAGESHGRMQYFQDYGGAVMVRVIRWGY